MKKELKQLIEAQINYEFESAYLYLSIATWANENGYPGTAHWMEKQAHEESEHALKMMHFLQEVNERVTLKGIANVATDFPGFMELFDISLKHEQGVTVRINQIYELALELKDHATAQFFAWFIHEQVEEEAILVDIITRLSKVPTPIGIMMMDDRLRARA